jgi:hypothetical protein
MGSPYPIGDVNLDGSVDGLDLEVVMSNLFTETSGWCSGNLNADTVIDGSDFNLLFDEGVSSTATIAEPSSGSLLYLFAFCLCFRRSHRS